MTRFLSRTGILSALFGVASLLAISPSLATAQLLTPLPNPTLSIFTRVDRNIDGKQFELLSTYRSVAMNVDVAALQATAVQQMTLREVPLAPGVTVDLEVKSWNVIEPGATMVLGTRNGDIPITPSVRLYRGKVKGDPNSDVYVSFANGSVVGRVSTFDKAYEFSTDFSVPTTNGLVPVVSYPTDALPNAMVKCGLSDEVLGTQLDDHWATYNEKGDQRSRIASANQVDFAVAGAWEGDVEYLELFNGDVQAAQDYMIQVIGDVSAIYERDLGTQLTVGYMKLWGDKGAAGYPYKETQVMSVALKETRDYWNTIDQATVPRSYAHTFSGKAWVNPIGIAFLDVLCQARNGAFTAITRTNTARDIRTVAHETGHNFGANHTHHCKWYTDRPDGSIDHCAPAEGGSCFTETQQTVGTIMSYCSQVEMKFHPEVIKLIRRNIETLSASSSCIVAAKKLLVSPDLVIFSAEVQGVARDSILEAFFTNVGQLSDIVVDSVQITGQNTDQFEILEGEPPFTLTPNESKRISVRFKAERTDEAVMHLKYFHTGLNPPIEVTFQGYASDIRPRISFKNDQGEIDWGQRIIGSQNDTSFKQFYLNLGVDGSQPDQRATLYMTKTSIEGPDRLDFQIVEGSAPMEIEGLDQVPAAFRFAPKTVGEKHAWLVVESNSLGRPGHLDSFDLSGTGKIGPIMQIAIPDLIIDFGDVGVAEDDRDTIFEDFFHNSGLEQLIYYTEFKMLEGEPKVFTTTNISSFLDPNTGEPLIVTAHADPTISFGLKRGRMVIQSSDEDNTTTISDDTLYVVANVVPTTSVGMNMEPDESFYFQSNPVTGGDFSFYLAPTRNERNNLFVLSVLDAAGREVYRQLGTFGEKGSMWHLDAHSWPSGHYFIRVSSFDGVRVRKGTLQK